MKNLTLHSQLSKEIFNTTQNFSGLLTKPQQRNFREMIRGMLISGSVFLSRIGNVNAFGVNARKNTERFSRMLSKLNIDQLHQLHINNQIGKYQNEPVLIFADGGDIQKPHSQKMEKVCKTVNGSDAHKPGKGYPLFSMVAYGTNSKKMTPLIQHLWSTQENEFKSEWCEQKKAYDKLSDFVESSAYDRIVIEDRGGDDTKRFAYFLNDLKCSFITRVNTGNNSRKVIIISKHPNGHKTKELLSLQQLVQRMKPEARDTKSWFNKKTKETLVSKIAYQKVYLPKCTNRKDVNCKENTPLYLVCVFTEGYDQPLAVLTDLKVNNSKKAWQYFFHYKKRWEVENFFRAEKQNFSAEKFLIRNLKAIKALVFMLMFTYHLLLKIQQKAKEFLGMMYQVFTNFCKRWQRKKQGHLDILAFLRNELSEAVSQYSYRFYSCKISRYRSGIDKKQPKLLDLRKKW